MIPHELRERPQWCYSLPGAKLPMNPNTGYGADTTDPTTWGTYEAARHCADQCGGYVGFVLSDADPYVIIDLDEPEPGPEGDIDRNNVTQLFQIFDYTYAETSLSGRGVHIVGRGNWPASARNRVGKVEVYGRERYIIFTGNVIAGRTEVTAFEQAQLDQLRQLMGDKLSTTDIQNVPARYSDEWVEAAARYNPPDGHIFAFLFDTPWHDAAVADRKSEYDQSLSNLIARWTGDGEQFLRLWQRSARWRPDDKRKGNLAQYNDYLLGTFKKSRAALQNSQFIPYWEVERGRQLWSAVVAHEQQAAAQRLAELDKYSVPTSEYAVPAEQKSIPMPPGLLGHLATYIYQQSVRPAWEIAVAGAIGLMAGVAGRKYNYSGTGLNQYVVVLAPSGVGKDAISQAFGRLIHAHERLYGLGQFQGPSSFTGGSALLKALDQNACMVSVITEFGKMLPQIVGQGRANSNTVPGGDLYSALLGVYNRSGAFQSFEGRGYAKKEDTITRIMSPAFTFVGDSQPDTFYKALDVEVGTEGFIPRLLIIDYSHGLRAPRNRSAHLVKPSAELVDGLATLIGYAAAAQGAVVDVQADPEAEAMLDALDARIDQSINATEPDDPRRPILNRTHLKALRLAALVAVGCNPANPVIDRRCAEWAIEVVEYADNLLLDRIGAGRVGIGENTDLAEVRDTLKAWMGLNPDTRRRYGATKQGDNVAGLVPFMYVYMRLKHKHSDHRLGAKGYLQQLMSSAEVLGWVTEAEMAVKQLHGYRPKTPVYEVGERLFAEH